MAGFENVKIERAETAAEEKELEEIAEEYRLALKNYEVMAQSLLDERDFDAVYSQEKEEIIEDSKPISGGVIDIWKFKNKAGKTEQFRYPDAEEGDFIHATTWNHLSSAASEKMKLLKASKSEIGEGIRFIDKRHGGPVADDLYLGRGQAQLKEDFAVAVKISKSVVDLLKEKKMSTASIKVVENAGNVAGEGYINADESQGLPLLFMKFGLPDGKWHTLPDILRTQEIRALALKKRTATA
jgi:hypothetical protein